MLSLMCCKYDLFIFFLFLFLYLRFMDLQVGLPNVGKSTLFNTLTKLSIPAENFPFCTIEPNEARINVPDERFDWLCQLYKPKSEVCLLHIYIMIWEVIADSDMCMIWAHIRSCECLTLLRCFFRLHCFKYICYAYLAVIKY